MPHNYPLNMNNFHKRSFQSWRKSNYFRFLRLLCVYLSFKHQNELKSYRTPHLSSPLKNVIDGVNIICSVGFTPSTESGFLYSLMCEGAKVAFHGSKAVVQY